MIQHATAKTVLHAGCGRKPLDGRFPTPQWREIRLDIDPAAAPDVVASITHMQAVATESVDAVWSSHTIEHLFPHEVPLALREFRRVLNPSGFLLITLPDIEEVARHVARGNLDRPLYVSPAGPISPIDVLFGHRRSMARGNLHMAHRTGFSAASLSGKLEQAGFRKVQVKTDRDRFALWARAYK